MQERRFAAPEAEICYFERGTPSPTQASLLLLHATGFHARCWDGVIAHLPQDQHVLAVDLRGHGRSANVPPDTWESFAGDVIALVKHLGLHGAVAAGHSMGGHCLVQTAYACPDAFRSLLLVDPVILPPEIYSGVVPRHQFPSLAEHPVARRRNSWRDWQQMFERFADRHPYSLWQPDVLEAYCRFGLLPAADSDGFELACPPSIEAAVYMGSAATDIHHMARQLTHQVTVMRAKPRDHEEESETLDFSLSPTWPGLADSMQHGRDVFSAGALSLHTDARPGAGGAGTVRPAFVGPRLYPLDAEGIVAADS